METLVVMHDRQQRQVMIRSGPQAPGAHHQVAVLLDVDRDPAVLFIRDGGSNRSRRAIADAVSTGTTDELVMPVKIPQFQRPILEERQVCDK